MLASKKRTNKLFYGWVIAVTCLIIGTVIWGTRYTFGVFFKSVESGFGVNRTVTSSVFSMYMVFCAIFAILGGWALDKYGPRRVTFVMGLFTGVSLILTGQINSVGQLFITYSLLLAIGTGAGFVVLSATTSRWFDQKRGLAVAIATIGSGLGTSIMAPIATYLIAELDWRQAYMVIGLVSGLITILLSLLLRSSPAERLADFKAEKIPVNTASGHLASMSLKQASKTRSLWFLGVAWFLNSLCLNLVLTHIVPYATDIGISKADAALILSLNGAAVVPARLIMGGISDRLGRKMTTIVCSLLQVFAMVWLIWAQELWALYLFAIVFGVGDGGFYSPSTAMVGDIFGLRNIGVIMGVLAAAWGIGAAIGPAMGGFIFDVSRSYQVAFVIGALAVILGTFLVAGLRQEVASA